MEEVLASHENRPVMRKVVENSAWGFFGSIVTRVGALIFTILLARFLLPEGYGIYGLAMSVAFFFSAFTNLGIDNALIRYISFALGKNNKIKSAAYFNYIFKIKVILVVSMFILLLILSYPLSMYVFKKPDLFLPLIMFSLYTIVLSLEGFLSSVFVALEKTKYSTMRETFSQVLRIGLVLGLFFYFAPGYYINGVITALTITSIFGVVYSLYLIKRISPFLLSKSPEIADKKGVKKFFCFFIIIGLSGIVFTYIDSIMLGIFIPKAEYLGYYKAAYTLIFSVTGLMTFSGVLLPFFTQFKKKNLEETVTKVLRYVCILTIPSVLGIIILGNYFVRAIYGVEYLPTTLPLYFLALLILSEGFVSIFGLLFTARGKPNLIIKPFIIASIMNVILNAVLILMLLKVSFLWATAGAGIATVISRYYYTSSIVIKSKKELGVKASYGFMYKIVFASIIMALVLLGVKYAIGDISVLSGILMVIIGIIVYFIALFAFGGIKKEDKEIIKTVLRMRR